MCQALFQALVLCCEQDRHKSLPLCPPNVPITVLPQGLCICWGWAEVPATLSPTLLMTLYLSHFIYSSPISLTSQKSSQPAPRATQGSLRTLTPISIWTTRWCHCLVTGPQAVVTSSLLDYDFHKDNVHAHFHLLIT